MSLLPNQTNIAKDTYFFLLANVSTLNVNSISTNSILVNNIDANNLNVSTIEADVISSAIAVANAVSTTYLDLDGQVLTATPTNLLLNGVPIATTSNLSSIADWALDPAISSVNVNGFDVLNANLVSSVTMRATNALFQNLIAYNTMFISSYVSSISSVNSAIENLFVSSLSSGNAYVNELYTSTISTNQITLDNQTLNATPTDLLLNGVPIATTSNLSSIADWSLDPAISTVYMNNNNLYSTATATIEQGLFSSISSGTADITSLYVLDLNNVSSLNNYAIDNFTLSTITALAYMSTPALYVSSINGAEFTSTTLTIEVAGVSSLSANFVSTIGAEIRQGLMSSIVFNPKVEFPLNFNFDFKPLAAAIGGGLTQIAIGLGGGLVAVASGLVALAVSRNNTTNINNNVYEQYSIPTQIQFSTLGELTSSYTRFVSSSGLPNAVPGQEYLVSTFIQPGTLCIRSFGDPVNLADPSTVTSSIQAFGQWVPVPLEVSSLVSTYSQLYTSTLNTSTINGLPISDYLFDNTPQWANYPAVSTISFSVPAVIQSANPSTDNIALRGSNIQLIASYTDAQNLLLVSSISTGTIFGANNDIFGGGLPFSTPGLSLNAPTIFLSTPQTLITGQINASTIGLSQMNTRIGSISSLNASSIQSFYFTAYQVNLDSVSTGNINAYDITSQTISTAVVLGAKTGTYDLELRTRTGGQIYLNSYQTTVVGNTLTSSVTADGVRADNGYFNRESVSSATISSINGLQYAPVRSAYNSTIVNAGLSTVAQVITSTIITLDIPSYVLSQANTSIQNTTGQYHESFLYIVIDGQQSASTVTTLINKTNSFAGQSISFRGPALSTGTYTCALWGYSDTDGDLLVSQCDLFTLTNLL